MLIPEQLRRIFDGRSCTCSQRVKVYRLNDEGKWDDRGTGHVSVEYLEVNSRPKSHQFNLTRI